MPSPSGIITLSRPSPSGVGCCRSVLSQRGSSDHSNDWMDAMASEVSTAGAQQDLPRRVVELERELAEARDQQTAAAEILHVIQGSPHHVQPVFDTIVRSAVKLCGGLFSALFQFDGELIHQVAQHNYSAEAFEQVRRAYPRPPTRAPRVRPGHTRSRGRPYP